MRMVTNGRNERGRMEHVHVHRPHASADKKRITKKKLKITIQDYIYM